MIYMSPTNAALFRVDYLPTSDCFCFISHRIYNCQASSIIANEYSDGMRDYEWRFIIRKAHIDIEGSYCWRTKYIYFNCSCVLPPILKFNHKFKWFNFFSFAANQSLQSIDVLKRAAHTIQARYVRAIYYFLLSEISRDCDIRVCCGLHTAHTATTANGLNENFNTFSKPKRLIRMRAFC